MTWPRPARRQHGYACRHRHRVLSPRCERRGPRALQTARHLAARGHSPLAVAPQVAGADPGDGAPWPVVRVPRSASPSRAGAWPPRSPSTGPTLSISPAPSSSAYAVWRPPPAWACPPSPSTRPTSPDTPVRTWVPARRPPGGASAPCKPPPTSPWPRGAALRDLEAHGVPRVRLWPRGVDTVRFRPDPAGPATSRMSKVRRRVSLTPAPAMAGHGRHRLGGPPLHRPPAPAALPGRRGDPPPRTRHDRPSRPAHHHRRLGGPGRPVDRGAEPRGRVSPRAGPGRSWGRARPGCHLPPARAPRRTAMKRTGVPGGDWAAAGRSAGWTTAITG